MRRLYSYVYKVSDSNIKFKKKLLLFESSDANERLPTWNNKHIGIISPDHSGYYAELLSKVERSQNILIIDLNHARSVEFIFIKPWLVDHTIGKNSMEKEFDGICMDIDMAPIFQICVIYLWGCILLYFAGLSTLFLCCPNPPQVISKWKFSLWLTLNLRLTFSYI